MDAYGRMCLIALLLILYTGLGNQLSAQSQASADSEEVTGLVFEKDLEGAWIPVAGASVYWAETTTGTATDPTGNFRLPRIEETSLLVVSFVGFHNDTMDMSKRYNVYFRLQSEDQELDEFVVMHHSKSTEVSYMKTMKVENVSEKELLKAACCNLSESFETTPSVDVSFTDAITGTRQIMMLGLAGPYTQLTRENMPTTRGLAVVNGMTFVPGTWIENIQLSKGTGSVVNGFESIAGQINFNLRNPASMDRVYLNLYANEGGRFEGNANFRADVGKNWGTGLLLHSKLNRFQQDRNDDGFNDMPIGDHFIGLNRWELYDDGLHIQFAGKVTVMNSLAGQTGYEPTLDAGSTNIWGMYHDLTRYEGWTKIGKVNARKAWQSVGFQASAAMHSTYGHFGRNFHEASQTSLYANLIFQSIIGNTNHQYRVGGSFMYDDFKEDLNDINYDRNETVPGVFAEYTYSNGDKFNMILGVRGDHHNHYDFFVTPRVHLRYAINENLVLRGAAGRGQRTSNVISENSGLLASSRQWIISSDGTDAPFGLKPEVAWNYGINLHQTFRLDYREGSVGIDIYRTQFENQVVVDLEDPRKALFYNLAGRSYANSIQFQAEYEIVKRVDARVAYRWHDVKTDFQDGLKQKPLVAPHRAFLNVAYASRKMFKADFTINVQGQKRIAGLPSNPAPFQVDENSPVFALVNLQVSKMWHHKFEVYVGMENALNYRQDRPIVGVENPFGDYFDATQVWGPVFGRNTYLGLRYKLK